MEDLYKKLYEKYDKLKKKQLSEFDELNKDQEVRFLNYVSVAEEMIQHLKDENDRSRKQASDLSSEVASIRSTKDEECAEYQKLLMGESQKNKMLSGEVEKLQNQLQCGLRCNSKDRNNENVQLNMLETAQVTQEVVSTDSTRRTLRKRSREARERAEEESTHGCNVVRYDAMEGGSAKRSSNGTVSCGDLPNDQQLESCGRPLVRSDGGIVADSGPANFQFQALLECLVGMKLSTVNQTDEVCVSALHQSSDKMLSGEVEKLQNQLQCGLRCNSKDRNNENVQLNMLETAQVTPEAVSTDLTRRTLRKCSREARERAEEESTHGCNVVRYDAMEGGSAKRSSNGTVSCGDLPNDQQLESCGRTLFRSDGGIVADSGPANFQFQTLLECLVGMKLSTVNQTDEVCVSALHQSSGYSFTLTWVKKEAEEEPELLYRVLTLGTFERIAPEWMRSILMFSMRMWPIFFERVSCVIKLHC